MKAEDTSNNEYTEETFSCENKSSKVGITNANSYIIISFTLG